MRQLFGVLFFLIVHWGYSQSDSSIPNIKPKLKVPFGTITKLETQIFDGDYLHIKEKEGTYLLKIISINDTIQRDTLLVTFVDESMSLANNNFDLYRLLYKKTVGTLLPEIVSKMKKIYVGKKYTIMAYETGQFTGIPKDYFEYQPIRADVSFHFKNYLIVVSNLTK